MANIFRDQEKFMKACDQTTGVNNFDQLMLYRKLISEELTELDMALSSSDQTEILDSLIDLLVVTVGAIHSLGADGDGAWKEVIQSNFAKIDKSTGKVRKRDDGKILKPLGWLKPQLTKFLPK